MSNKENQHAKEAIIRDYETQIKEMARFMAEQLHDSGECTLSLIKPKIEVDYQSRIKQKAQP